MAVTNLWNGQLVEASQYTINANEPVDLLTSAAISNTAGANSLRLTTKFVNLVPSGGLLTAQMGWEVDYKDENNAWQVLPVYQGNWVRKSDQAPVRILIMQPNIQQLNVGETDIQFRGPLPLVETNRHQGTVPTTDIRVRFVLVEGDPGGTFAMDRITVSAEIDLYSA